MLTAATGYEVDKEDWLSYVERKKLYIAKDINNEPKKESNVTSLLRNYKLLNIQRTDSTSRTKRERFSSVNEIHETDERQAKPKKESNS